MTAYELSEVEAQLITDLRSGDHDTVFGVVEYVLKHYVAPLQVGMETPEIAAMLDADKNLPPLPPPVPYTPPRYSKLRWWLIRHGIEFEYSPDIQSTGGFQRHMCIVLNHRYYGIGIMLDPFKGVFRDELDKSHAEIAAEYEQGRQP